MICYHRRDMRKSTALFFSLILLMVFTSAVGAQQNKWFEGKRIARIEFVNLETVSETEVKGLVDGYLGKSYNSDISIEIQSKLYALEYFDQIVMKILPMETDDDAITLSIEVQERPSVSDVLVEGNDQLRKGVILDSVLVKKGDLLKRSTVRLDEQNLLDLYHERGYLAASVDSRIEINEEENNAVVIFMVDEGKRTTLEEIRFKGNEFGDRNALLGVMESKTKRFLRAGVFQENQFKDDLRRIVQYYQNEGFIDAEIVNVDRVSRMDEEKKQIYLTITIEISEGEQYYYGGVSFEGNNLFSDERLRGKFFLEVGEPFNKQRFDNGYQMMSDVYYDNGYIFNEITREEKRDPQEMTVSYTIKIVERPRAHIENVIVKGNTKTKDYVIYREIPVEVGDVFNKNKVIQGMQNLYNLQYFQTVEPQTYPGSADGLMDLVVNVEEGKTANILFGVTISGTKDFPVSGQLKWSDSNFLGRGQTIGVDLSANHENQSISLNVSEGWLFDRRWNISTSLSYQHQLETGALLDIDGTEGPDPYTKTEYEDAIANGETLEDLQTMSYDTHTIGLGLSTGYTKHTFLGRFSGSFGGGTSMSLTTYDETKYTPYLDSLKESHGTWILNNNLRFKVVYDGRDLIYNPSKGGYLSQAYTYAGGILGGDSHYIKYTTRGDLYFTLFDIPVSEKWNWKNILKLNSVVSLVTPQYDGQLNNEELMVIDGMFVGRGWYERSLYQGRALWKHTIELRMPITEQFIWWDTFVDAAAVWNSPSEIPNATIDDYYFSMGTGMRIAYPQFPLSLYLTKKFRVHSDGSVDWIQGNNFFTDWGGLDLVLTFNLDLF